MSGSYANKTFDEDTIVWTNQVEPANALSFSSASLAESFNESYRTAADGNETQYLSILESPHDVTLEVLDNLTLSNSKIMGNSLELNVEQEETADLNVADNADQVVVFTVDGSDDLYGIQIVHDEKGNAQKYEFKFRQTEGGQLEAIPETIHLLLNEGEVSSKQELFENHELLNKNTLQFHEDQTTDHETTLQSEEMENAQSTLGFIKGEPTEEVNYQQVEEEESEPQEEEDREHTDVDIKPAVLEFQEPVPNMKSELLQEHTADIPEIYQPDEIEEQMVYQNETVQKIFEHDDSNEEDHCNVQIEETLIQKDGNFYEENIEEVTTYETIHFSHNQMILEAQYIPENEDCEAGEEYPHYESVYIQSADSSEQIEEGVVHTEERNTEPNEEYNHSNDAEFQVVEGIHVTAEESILKDSYQENAVPAAVLKQPAQKNNVLKQQSVVNSTKLAKKSKKVLCYVVQHPEKENVNSMPTMVPRNYKANPRSVLKQSAVDHSLAGAAATETLHKQKDLQSEKSKIDKRFAKSKDAIQAKLFNNFLSKTTIPHAPVRQKRLPRKQEIKPVDTRREEEIIVQEVMVSSKGFIESVEDRLKGKEKLEVVGYIDLSDSEDENSNQKKSSKSDGVIEILSSEDEADVPEPAASSKAPETPKKRRGRPRKNADNSDSPQKESENDEGQDSADESSPSKKVRTDASETESDSSKKELSCTLCTKTFPSPNSLSTHMHHHNLENRIRKSRVTTFEFKHKCLDCETTFKNALLLTRHCCAKKPIKKIVVTHECNVCKKTFDSQMLLNVHKRTHESSGSENSFLRPNSCVKRLTLAKKPADDDKNRESRIHTKPSTVVSRPMKTPVPPRRAEPVLDGASKYKCEKCEHSFKNGILLKKHVCSEEKVNRLKCGVCGLTFKDLSLLNIHKKKHVKENMFNVTSEVQISPMKYLPKGKRDVKKSPRKSFGKLKDTNKGSPSFKILKKFACTTCNARFASRVLLDIHRRKQCVKSPSKNRRLSLAKNTSIANLTVMPSTPVDMQAECGTCSKKFKTFRMLLRHQVTEHDYSPPDKADLMKPKTKPIGLKLHGGIPANPRLQKFFPGLISVVQSVTPLKSNDH